MTLRSIQFLILFAFVLPRTVIACDHPGCDGGGRAAAAAAAAAQGGGGGRNAPGGGGGGSGGSGGGGGLDAESARYEACVTAMCPSDNSTCQAQCVRDPSGKSWVVSTEQAVAKEASKKGDGRQNDTDKSPSDVPVVSVGRSADAEPSQKANDRSSAPSSSEKMAANTPTSTSSTTAAPAPSSDTKTATSPATNTSSSSPTTAVPSDAKESSSDGTAVVLSPAGTPGDTSVAVASPPPGDTSSPDAPPLLLTDLPPAKPLAAAPTLTSDFFSDVKVLAPDNPPTAKASPPEDSPAKPGDLLSLVRQGDEE